MRQLLHFWGLKRSGNHAILPWIIDNISAHEAGVSFFNDILEHPTFYAEMPRVVSDSHNYTSILSYEDCDLSHAMTIFTVVKQELVMLDSQYRHLILMRDPFNLFASRMKRIKNLEDEESVRHHIQSTSWATVVRLWKQYAREYLGETNFLGTEKVPINYNKWVASRTYRDSVLEKLGYSNLDISKERIGNYGQGSSFDLLSKDGQASTMEVFDRWRYFEENKTFLSLFQDPEVVDLSFKIFGHIEGTEFITKHL